MLVPPIYCPIVRFAWGRHINMFHLQQCLTAIVVFHSCLLTAKRYHLLGDAGMNERLRKQASVAMVIHFNCGNGSSVSTQVKSRHQI